MLQGLLQTGFGIGNAPNEMERRAQDYYGQAQGFREKAFQQSAPRPRQITGLEGIGALLAALIDPQMGGGFLQGLNQGFQQENERRTLDWQNRQRGLLQQAEGQETLGQQQERRLGRVQDARQSAMADAFRRQEANREQANFSQTRKDRQAENVFNAWNRRMDAKLDRESRERMLGVRGNQKLVQDSYKALRDPKSTRAARMDAIAALQEAGQTFAPDVLRDYMDSTYYEDNQRAKTATENETRPGKVANLTAGAGLKRAQTGLTNEKATSERELRPGKIANQKADVTLKAARAANLDKLTSWMDAKAADQFRRTDAYLENTLSLIRDRNARVSGQDIRAAITANSKQANVLRAAKSRLEAQLPKIQGPDREKAEDQIRFYDASISQYKKDFSDLQDRLKKTKPTAPEPVFPANPLSGRIGPNGTELGIVPDLPARRTTRKAAPARKAPAPKAGTTKRGTKYRIVE